MLPDATFLLSTIVQIMPKEHLHKAMQNTLKTIWIFFFYVKAEKSLIF